MKKFISSELDTPSRYRSVRYKTISKETNIEGNNSSQIELPDYVRNRDGRKLSEKRERKNYSEFATLSYNRRTKIRTEYTE